MNNVISLITMGMLGFAVVACQPAQKDPNAKAAIASQPARGSASASSAPMVGKAESNPTPTTPIVMNWTLVDSGLKPVDKQQFNYPFALESEPVKAYAQMYHVDNVTSRYNLTVGMAVNEILSKVLDQVGTAYLSHELTAGKDSAFIIHTTSQVAPSEHTYVFAEPFAKGLTIPVKIINDAKK